LDKVIVISIVDDDELSRDATSRLIRSVGYATATFASGEEFLQSGRANDTACLVSDVQMPGMSGLDLQDRLKASGARLPIIFITAFPETEARRRALAGGALGFLDKPFSEEELIACLHQALPTGTS
jgi:FixJ family two-component response regulator